MERGKRGRLSSLNLLPEEAQPDVQWAYDEVKARRLPQLRIVEELNKRLADRGIGPISKSAFNRKVMWLMGFGDGMLKAREIAAVMAEKLNDVPEGDVGLLLGELLKTITFDIVTNAQVTDTLSMNMAVQASVALQKLEDARRISVSTREKIAKVFADKASEAVEKAGQAKGLSRDTIEEIKDKILGITRGSRK